MKKILFTLLISLLIAGASHYEHNYTRKNCEVIQINDGIATVYDEVGEAWDFKNCGLSVGDIVELKMYDNNTSNNINDDVIKEVIKRVKY